MIEKTKNYKQFKAIRGNRGLNRKYVTRLAESIRENDLLAQNPIIVNSRMEVVDGQHRLKVAEMLGLEVFYTVVPTGNIEDVQMLNTNVRQWTTLDFLESHIARGNREYMSLRDFSDKNGLTVSISMHLLTGGYYTGLKNKELLNDFRSGDFKVTSAPYAEDMVKRVRSLRPYLSEDVATDREFFRALEKTYVSGFTHENLLEKLKASGERITYHGSLKDYIRNLEDILSYRSPVIHRIKKGDK